MYDYSNFSEEELDEKILDVQNKMSLAFQQGHEGVVQQLSFILEQLNYELQQRLEDERSNAIVDRTPDSLIIGEDIEDDDADDDE